MHRDVELAFERPLGNSPPRKGEADEASSLTIVHCLKLDGLLALFIRLQVEEIEVDVGPSKEVVRYRITVAHLDHQHACKQRLAEEAQRFVESRSATDVTQVTGLDLLASELKRHEGIRLVEEPRAVFEALNMVNCDMQDPCKGACRSCPPRKRQQHLACRLIVVHRVEGDRGSLALLLQHEQVEIDAYLSHAVISQCVTIEDPYSQPLVEQRLAVERERLVKHHILAAHVSLGGGLHRLPRQLHPHVRVRLIHEPSRICKLLDTVHRHVQQPRERPLRRWLA